ncbi:hypothetical protein CPC08DRAFT_637221, partial [Agrocybe pediades]
LTRCLQRRYEALKSQYPSEGRRRWCLRVLYESWPILAHQAATSAVTSSEGKAAFETDSDPMDAVLEDEEIGLIIRTDFTDDEAWNTFRQKVQTSQKEFLAELSGGNNQDQDQAGDAESSSVVQDATMDKAQTMPDANEESSDSSDELPDIVKILDPSDAGDRQKLSDISNIAALRLFNDVDIRPAPSLPAETKRISPQNPLIDLGGWQEIYTGKNIWIYDSASNKDECVRVVSQESNFYGTATGDSWRARGAHVCELQFNMTYQGLKIDFNGLDKWDYNQRLRNLQESTIL